LKTSWFPVSAISDRSKYYVTTATDGNAYALVSMHIFAKQIPNWTWATFEHEDNPGRCDYMGCKDAFGEKPYVASHNPPGQFYGSCVSTGLAMQIRDCDELSKFDHRVLPPARMRSLGDAARSPRA
jgi:hypothetical protein